MAHIQQFRFVNFVKECLPEYFTGRRVLEVGALDINGSARSFFADCDYTGIDVAAGKGVDQVAKGEDFAADANAFDVVISCECMEHNPMYLKTWLNMLRVLREDGLLLMTCATFGRPQHGTSASDPSASPLTIGQGQEYYRNLGRQDFEVVHLPSFFARHFFEVDHSSKDLYFLGLGAASSAAQQQRFDTLRETAARFYEQIARSGLG